MPGSGTSLKAGAWVLGLVAVSAAAATPAVATPGSPAAPLSWEQAFPIDRAADVHLSATFTGSDGQPHRLELWRRGQTFLHRKTDDSLELYVVSDRKTRDHRYRFVDHRRHVVTGVRRGNLYRIGVFSDWFGLAHIIERPKVAFQVRAVPDPRPASARRDCAWRVLTTTPPGGQPTEARICWSARWGVPLLIEQRNSSGSWVEALAVRSAQPPRLGRVASGLPSAPPRYAYIDADGEIAPQSAD